MTAAELFEGHYHVAERSAKARRVPRRHRDDALQEAAAGLWHAALRYDRKRGEDFARYASRCAAGHVVHFLRVSRRRPPEECRDLAGLPAPPSGDGDSAELVETLLVCVGRTERDWLLRHYGLGESYREIAAADGGVSASKVCRTVCRGLQRVREYAAALGYGGGDA